MDVGVLTEVSSYQDAYQDRSGKTRIHQAVLRTTYCATDVCIQYAPRILPKATTDVDSPGLEPRS